MYFLEVIGNWESIIYAANKFIVLNTLYIEAECNDTIRISTNGEDWTAIDTPCNK